MSLDEDAMEKALDVLVQGVCVPADDPASCEKGVRTWYPQMEAVLAESDGVHEYLCTALNMCPDPMRKIFLDPCQHCQDGMAAIGGLYEDEQVIAAATAFFNGPDFCEQENFDQATQEACKTYIGIFVPAAWPILGGSITEDAEEICTMAGFCTA